MEESENTYVVEVHLGASSGPIRVTIPKEKVMWLNKFLGSVDSTFFDEKISDIK